MDTQLGNHVFTKAVFKENKTRFIPEFKLEALDQDYSILQTRRALDVGQTALRRWVEQIQFEKTGYFCFND